MSLLTSHHGTGAPPPTTVDAAVGAGVMPTIAARNIQADIVAEWKKFRGAIVIPFDNSKYATLLWLPSDQRKADSAEYLG